MIQINTDMLGFPSPCRGLIFLTVLLKSGRYELNSFRPLAGDLSSLQEGAEYEQVEEKSFRPLAGDLSSLQ